MPEVITVKQEGMKVSKAPDILSTENIGDCLVLALHDGNGIGGLAHIYISTEMRKLLAYHIEYLLHRLLGIPVVTADSTVREILNEMRKHGSDLRNVTAKMCGEQERYFYPHFPPRYCGGDKKSRIVKQELQRYGIPLVAEDLGGSGKRGRNVEYYLATGEMKITYMKRVKKSRLPIGSELRILNYKII